MAPSVKYYSATERSGMLPDFNQDPGQSLEQLIRALLSKNKNLVIVIPEIMIWIVNQFGKVVMPVCSEYDNGFEINVQLANFYHLPVVIKFNHVPCNETVSPRNMHRLAVKYQASYGIDFHPSSLVHEMMAEFILHYFWQSLTELNSSVKEAAAIMTPVQLPKSTLYKSSQYYDKEFSFQCFIDIQEPNFQKYEILNASLPGSLISYGNLTLNSVRGILSGKFHFVLNQTHKCGNRGFEIDLYIAHKLCLCGNSKAVVEVEFTFTNSTNGEMNTFGPYEYTFSLLGIGFKPVVVQKLIPQNAATQKMLSCKPGLTLSTINLTLKAPTSGKKYPIDFYSMIVEYRCCFG